MRKYIFKRLLISIATLFVILFILFLMLDFMPGSPFNDEKLTPDQRQLLAENYGLNDPFLIRFFRYVWNMLHGDFGVSYNIQANMPVTAFLKGRILISVRIGLQAAVVGTAVGLLLGILAALRKGSFFDTLATVISVLGISIPNFVFALVLSYFLGFKWKLFPILYDVSKPFISSILPTISLAMFAIASIARYTRNELISVLNSDYILLAQSKGLTGYEVVWHHALRNGLIGIITVLGPLIVNMLTGSLVVEKAFSIPGIGSLFTTAVQSNDYNIVLAISFLYSVLYIGVMLLVDLLYGVIDPRIRIASEA